MKRRNGDPSYLTRKLLRYRCLVWNVALLFCCTFARNPRPDQSQTCGQAALGVLAPRYFHVGSCRSVCAFPCSSGLTPKCGVHAGLCTRPLSPSTGTSVQNILLPLLENSRVLPPVWEDAQGRLHSRVTSLRAPPKLECICVCLSWTRLVVTFCEVTTHLDSGLAHGEKCA